MSLSARPSLQVPQYVADIFLRAAMDGVILVCERLLEDVVAYKPIAKITDQYGRSALHWAAYNGHNEMVKWLLKNWPDLLDLKTLNGSTALHYAIIQRHLAICKYLLRCGASCTVKNADDDNAFNLALKSVNLDIKNHFKEYKTELDKRYQAAVASGDKKEADESITPGTDSIAQAQVKLTEVKKHLLFPPTRSLTEIDELQARLERLKGTGYVSVNISTPFN